ncbi:hypothetical protein COLO4_11817 [Corchorus olitorius]|uniref:Uncharacterized protein n=1 Tax=Corchorus olitorius TaxID=93759 RepID=A0A1R3K329_9ROSI|nr:hypothetical protein COLO4_11817 [Corchorus olitorius]
MGMLQRLSGEKAPTQAQEQKIAVLFEIDTTVVTSGIETENVSTVQTTLPAPLFNSYMYPQVPERQYTFPVASATTRSRVRKMEEQAAQIQQLKQSQEEMRYSQEEMRQEQGVIKEQLSVIMGML